LQTTALLKKPQALNRSAQMAWLGSLNLSLIRFAIVHDPIMINALSNVKFSAINVLYCKKSCRGSELNNPSKNILLKT